MLLLAASPSAKRPMTFFIRNSSGSLVNLLNSPESIEQTPKHSPQLNVPSLPQASPPLPPSTSTPTTTAPPAPSATEGPKFPPAIPNPTGSARKHVCHCGKAFTTSGHLARHTRIHTGERNFKCEFKGCNATFSRRDNCLQHYRTHFGLKVHSHARRKNNSSPSPGGSAGSSSSSSTSSSSSSSTASSSSASSTPISSSSSSDQKNESKNGNQSNNRSHVSFSYTASTAIPV